MTELEQLKQQLLVSKCKRVALWILTFINTLLLTGNLLLWHDYQSRFDDISLLKTKAGVQDKRVSNVESSMQVIINGLNQLGSVAHRHTEQTNSIAGQ